MRKAGALVLLSLLQQVYTPCFNVVVFGFLFFLGKGVGVREKRADGWLVGCHRHMHSEGTPSILPACLRQEIQAAEYAP